VQVELGLGDEPSACAIDNQEAVHCWGAGYSRLGRPARRVEFPNSGGDAAAFGLPGAFIPGCGVERKCARVAATLPSCSASETSRSVSAALKDAESSDQRLVTVRGELGLGLGSELPLGVGGCGASGELSCCPPESSAIVIRDGTAQLFIDGRRCSGDRSRMCCDTPAFGQPVLVRGRLTFRTEFRTLGAAWVLTETTLCELR
jgi:hypothetical protein